MNPYVSHLATLPSSFTTCKSATQALSPSDLIISRKQEKEILSVQAQRRSKHDSQAERRVYNAEPTRDQCRRSNSEMTMSCPTLKAGGGFYMGSTFLAGDFPLMCLF